ncbi:MAG: alpha/beta fold hydrolase [Sporichthyaceae bacterium]
MSIPPHLSLPAGVVSRVLSTARGDFAVLEATCAPADADELDPDEEDLDPVERPSGTVVLVPGYTGSKEDYLPILDRLAEVGYRVLAIDQRGQCDTPGPDDPAAYTLDALAADVLAIADALGDGPVHLVGHSFGGLVVREVAIARPAAARSVTLLCSGRGRVPVAQGEKTAMLLEALGSLDLADIWEIAAASAAARGEHDGVGPDVLDFLRRRFTSSARAGYAAMGAQLIDTPDRTAELRASGVPTLVAHGVDDDVWPPQEQLSMAVDLASVYEVFDKAGHSPAVQDPVATAAALLAFWSSVD